MSHFFVAVIIPKDAGEDEVGRLLEPYNENIQTAPRREKCWCVGKDAKKEVEEAALLQLGYANWDEVGEACRKAYPEEATDKVLLSDTAQFNWQQFVAPIKAIEKELLKYAPMVNKADKACEACNGSGWSLTTYNPDSKWDWWVVGGRWDKVIKGDFTEKGFNFEASHHSMVNNSVMVEDLLALSSEEFENRIPFSVVDPKGIWYEKGNMGWWGMARNLKPKNTWSNQVISLLKKFPGHLVVGCDLHI